MSIFLFAMFLIPTVFTRTEIPTTFSGSPEVFSGYLPDCDKYVEAFSYDEDCEVIEGTALQVSMALPQLSSNGKFSAYIAICVQWHCTNKLCLKCIPPPLCVATD